MNTFFEYEDIYGKVDVDYLTNITREFFELAADIRSKLGKQGYILEKYLSLFFEGLGAAFANSVSERKPASNAAHELHGLITSAMSSKSDCGHPFYEKAKDFIESNPLDFQEEATRYSIYCAELLSDFLASKADHWRHDLKEAVRAEIDIVALRYLHRDIDAIIGTGPMEKLNFLMRQRFLVITPLAAMVQELTRELLFVLTYRDDETSRQVMGLCLDRVGMLKNPD